MIDRVKVSICVGKKKNCFRLIVFKVHSLNTNLINLIITCFNTSIN